MNRFITLTFAVYLAIMGSSLTIDYLISINAWIDFGLEELAW